MADKWVTTVCDRCYVGCGIRAHVVDEVVVSVEGDPDNPQNKGKMCAKGKAGIMAHYSPYRIKVPLKRTNPQKGIGVDPKWQEISWDEAINTVVENLRKIQDEPQKLCAYGWGGTGNLNAFCAAFGSPNVGGGSTVCGKAIHPVENMAGGGFHQQADLHYCNYLIYTGTNGGVGTRASTNHVASDFADARARGMKLVVVDPISGYAAAKSDEWVPILPGTDSAFALAFLHVLLNELGIYDAEFLKKRTNAAYLVGADGYYVREPASQKPLIYDPVDKAVKTWDDPTIKDFALEGTYMAHGASVTPSFILLKKHVAKYPPEWASGITTIPAATIRRIAKEFGEAAQIGSTITIQGVQLPYRPVAVDWAKGPQGHRGGFANCWALKLINIVMGNVNIPGGIMSTGGVGKKPFRWWPETNKLEGMIEEGAKFNWGKTGSHSAYPGRQPAKPTRMDIFELFPIAGHTHTTTALVAADPAKYDLDYKTEVMIHSPTNTILTSFANIKVSERFLKSLKFIMGFAFEINETNEFDDIVFPAPSYLERSDFGGSGGSGGMYGALSPVAEGDWFFSVRQPVVEPPPGMKHPEQVMLEIADRLGIRADYYAVMDKNLQFKEPYQLEPSKKYTLEEIWDLQAKSVFGPDKGLEWLKGHGVVRIPRDAEEAYPGPFIDARVPIYLEHLPRRGEELEEVTKEMELPWDLSGYTALPEWRPCESWEARARGEDVLITVHYKLPFSYGSYSNENPWINELCERTPYTYPVLINEDVGKKKGIRDGDEIWVESPVRKVKATAKLTQCIHPSVIGIGGHFGSWAQGKPISKGKGVAFNPLLPHDMEHMDMVTTAQECCAVVKVYKA